MLKANRKGQWRYRIGNYRVIVNIQDENLVVLALEVGHRKNIYNSLYEKFEFSTKYSQYFIVKRLY